MDHETVFRTDVFPKIIYQEYLLEYLPLVCFITQKSSGVYLLAISLFVQIHTHSIQRRNKTVSILNLELRSSHIDSFVISLDCSHTLSYEMGPDTSM